MPAEHIVLSPESLLHVYFGIRTVLCDILSSCPSRKHFWMLHVNLYFEALSASQYMYMMSLMDTKSKVHSTKHLWLEGKFEISIIDNFAWYPHDYVSRVTFALLVWNKDKQKGEKNQTTGEDNFAKCILMIPMYLDNLTTMIHKDAWGWAKQFHCRFRGRQTRWKLWWAISK